MQYRVEEPLGILRTLFPIWENYFLLALFNEKTATRNTKSSSNRLIRNQNPNILCLSQSLDLDFLLGREENVVPLDVQLPQTEGLLPRERSQDQPELVLGQWAGGEVHWLKVDDELQVQSGTAMKRAKLEVLKSWESVNVSIAQCVKQWKLRR